MSYEGWTNWDTWNTTLIIDNEQPLYNRKLAIAKNFALKIKKGIFDPKMAEKAMTNTLIPLAIKQDKQYGGGTSEIDKKKINKAEMVSWVVDEAVSGDMVEREKAQPYLGLK